MLGTPVPAPSPAFPGFPRSSAPSSQESSLKLAVIKPTSQHRVDVLQVGELWVESVGVAGLFSKLCRTRLSCVSRCPPSACGVCEVP